ncbi:MAG TPA: adenylyltransferase/cytidyltransferase family protein [Candidatus Saccharimonadales bacterium]|nr:adenylyltransferase/cytidyltransferase family protein [Candidatus Saccharimonadales bacterium]
MSKFHHEHLKSQAYKVKLHKNRPDKLVDFKDLQKLGKKLHLQGKKIVFATGSYDLLNPGHCRYLAEAKSLGDILVVGVSTDYSDAQLKGPDFPLIGEEIRAELVSCLKAVDYVVIIDEYRPHAVLALLQPDIFFTSESSWKSGLRDIQETSIVKSYGGKVYIRELLLPAFGTQELVEHIANIRVIQILESYLKEKVPGFFLDPEKHLKPAQYGDQQPKLANSFNSSNLIIDFADLAALGETLRKKKRKVVYVAGSYDLLHVGHARFIEQAGILGDVLIVGIPSDSSLRNLKGIGRPMISERDRAYVLGHLDTVDYVSVFPDRTVYSSLYALKPDIFFTVSEAWNKGYKNSPEYKLVKSYGGNVVVAERQSPFISSSAMIDKMAYSKVMEIFKECMTEDRYLKLLNEKSRLIRTNDVQGRKQ